jgi:hypothetical protein
MYTKLLRCDVIRRKTRKIVHVTYVGIKNHFNCELFWFFIIYFPVYNMMQNYSKFYTNWIKLLNNIATRPAQIGYVREYFMDT